MTFETLVIILLSVVIILQLLNTTAMTVFIYLGWRHDQNLDRWGVDLVACLQRFENPNEISGRKVRSNKTVASLTEEIRSIRDTDDGK